MFGNFFVKTSSPKTLQEFGHDMGRELGFGALTERESSNYVDGHYFLAKCLGVEVKISLTDDDDLEEYPFHLCMDADGYWVDEGDAFEAIADLLARKLTLAGYSVARCPDFGRIGAAILHYSIKAGLRGHGRNEIDVLNTDPPPTPDYPGR
jgi:hypothetical protein